MKAASEIRAKGIKGTTICNLGGVGLGYKYEGVVYSSGGNGFYYEKRNLKTFVADNGEGYMNRVKGIFPAIKSGSLAH